MLLVALITMAWIVALTIWEGIFGSVVIYDTS